MNIVIENLKHLKAKKEILLEFKDYYQKESKKECILTGRNNDDSKSEDNNIIEIDRVTDSEKIQEIEYQIHIIEERIVRIGEALERLDGLDEKIYYCRKIEGLTQEQAAEKLYISTRHLQRIESKLNKKEKNYKVSC